MGKKKDIYELVELIEAESEELSEMLDMGIGLFFCREAEALAEKIHMRSVSLLKIFRKKMK